MTAVKLKSSALSLRQPVAAAVVALLVGGLVIAVTGADPIIAYRGILDGSGLNWLSPWLPAADRPIAAASLQQTLIVAAPLALLGLSVAYAFRAGLFNIGGQGQYLIGLIASVWLGSSTIGLPAWMQIAATMLVASLAGAAWAGIAGVLKARAGTSEVITTIMLNYLAIWIGVYLFELGGPLQGQDRSLPQSDDVLPSVRLPVLWGQAELQGMHLGVLIAIAGVALYWLLLNRSRQGYEVRAVGLNPECAAYGGIEPARIAVKAMLIAGAFAGLAGSIDVLGWAFRVNTADIQASQVGFFGIAVALLGRGSAPGIFASALLFGALVTGTSVRNLDPEAFPPQLATTLATILQGVIVLLVSAPMLATLRGRRRRLGAPTTTRPVEEGLS
jgi:general nucleoside transport system permease protein